MSLKRDDLSRSDFSSSMPESFGKPRSRITSR